MPSRGSGTGGITQSLSVGGGAAGVAQVAGDSNTVTATGRISSDMPEDVLKVVTASSDNMVVIYPVPFSPELESLARQSLTRCLTTAQREAFGLFVDEDRYLVHAPPC